MGKIKLEQVTWQAKWKAHRQGEVVWVSPQLARGGEDLFVTSPAHWPYITFNIWIQPQCPTGSGWTHQRFGVCHASDELFEDSSATPLITITCFVIDTLQLLKRAHVAHKFSLLPPSPPLPYEERGGMPKQNHNWMFEKSGSSKRVELTGFPWLECIRGDKQEEALHQLGTALPLHIRRHCATNSFIWTWYSQNRAQWIHQQFHLAAPGNPRIGRSE